MGTVHQQTEAFPAVYRSAQVSTADVLLSNFQAIISLSAASEALNSDTSQLEWDVAVVKQQLYIYIAAIY